MQKYWKHPQMREHNMLASGQRSPSQFYHKPGGKPTTGMSSENIAISNASKQPQFSGKPKYPFDLHTPTGTKIFKLLLFHELPWCNQLPKLWADQVNNWMENKYNLTFVTFPLNLAILRRSAFLNAEHMMQ